MRQSVKRTLVELLTAGCLLASLLAAPSAAAQQVATIRRVTVLSHGGTFELEIDASQPVTPKTIVVTGPDRLVIDFPNAVPGRSLRPMLVKTSQVKGIRMGLFESSPPVARVVLDLTTPQPFELYPSGNRVIVKLASGGARNASVPSVPANGVPTNVPAAILAANAAPPQPPPPPQPHAEVELRDGKLSISSDRARLIDILHEVQRRTGATLAIPPGGGQEAVIAHLGPASVRDVLSSLLNGSAYNVVLVGSGADRSSVSSIILTTKGAEGESMPANFSARAGDEPQAAPPVPDAPPPTVDNPPPDAMPPPPDVPTPDAPGQPPQ